MGNRPGFDLRNVITAVSELCVRAGAGGKSINRQKEGGVAEEPTDFWNFSRNS